jgi:hypothetical protein
MRNIGLLGVTLRFLVIVIVFGMPMDKKYSRQIIVSITMCLQLLTIFMISGFGNADK